MNLEELDRVLDGAREAPLSEADYEKLKDALHALAERLVRQREYREDQRGVRQNQEGSEPGDDSRITSRRRLRAMGAMAPRRIAVREKVAIAHEKLAHGDRCPDCGQGNVYGQKEPKALVRIVGQAPLAATVYRTGTAALQRLRAGVHGAGAGRRGPGEVR